MPSGARSAREVVVVRHGETAWSLSGQHTGTTDIPLTDNGRGLARRLRPALMDRSFALVLTSPLQRARETCALGGLAEAAAVDGDLVEWNYGKYEGRITAEIHNERPDWRLFRDGCPGGETAKDVADRADRIITRVRRVSGNVLIFSSAHFLRVLAARWLGLAPEMARCFVLSTASISALGYEHDLSEPVIRLWDDTRHVET